MNRAQVTSSPRSETTDRAHPLVRLPEILQVLRKDPSAWAALPLESIPEALGLLRTIELALLTRQIQPAITAMASPDRLEVWLTAQEVAQQLKRTRAWVYRQARRWPFAKRPSRKTLLSSSRT